MKKGFIVVKSGSQLSYVYQLWMGGQIVFSLDAEDAIVFATAKKAEMIAKKVKGSFIKEVEVPNNVFIPPVLK